MQIEKSQTTLCGPVELPRLQFEKPCFIITCHLVEEQNEVECKGDEESQEAQVVEIARQIILEEKLVYLLDAVRIKSNE